MDVYQSHSFFVLFMFLSFVTRVFGQQSPSLPSALRLPSGASKTASGKPIRCSPKNTKLNPSTHKLISECGAQAFCLAAPGSLSNSTGQGICVSRLCRGDQYPYGYARFGGQSGGAAEVPWTNVKGKLLPVGDDDERLQSMLPPMCPEGSFCPDRGSGCQPKVESGGACELGRDEQCRNPPTDEELPAGSLNRAVCLNSKCVPATQTLNALCSFENITSVSDINQGLTGSGQFTSSVFRHNCLSPFLFCDLTALLPDGSGPTCQPTRKIGQRCSFDEQCKTGNCDANICSLPPGTPTRLAPWHWAATILFIFFALVVNIATLIYIHHKKRYAFYQEVQEYYDEQMSIRRAILDLHADAGEKSIVVETKARGGFD